MELLSLFDITFFLLVAFGTLVGIIFGAIPGMTDHGSRRMFAVDLCPGAS